MKKQRNHEARSGKRVRRRLRASLRRMQKQIDALRTKIRGGSTNAIVTCRLMPPSAAMVYDSEFQAIQKHVLKYPNLETGGSLYGWYSETGLPIIALATGPGRNAVHESTRFHADEQFSMEIGSKIVNYGLQHVGEWHSHHTLGLAQPSGIDCRAMQASIGSSPTGRFLCGIANIVGDKVTFNLFFFSTEKGLNYTCPQLVVREGVSPLRIGLCRVLGPIEQEGAVI